MPAAVDQVQVTPNVLLLAAENSADLLSLLRRDSSLACKQDEHGYSLLHAAVSYNYLDLARSLKNEFSIDPNILDEDGETALFVVETVEAAKCLLEEVGTNLDIKNAEGETAEEKIRAEGDFVTVADYLKEIRVQETVANGQAESITGNGTPHPPPLPPGVELRVGSLEDEEGLGEVADPELRRRIEELASREDFQGEDAQSQLRQLITDALRGANEEQREVRPRTG